MGSQKVVAHFQRLARQPGDPSPAQVLMRDTPTGTSAGESPYRSLMQPAPLAVLAHPFGPELKRWEQGVEVDCGPDWHMDHIKLALSRGPHPSALTPDAIELFEHDIAYQVRAGFSQVLLAKDLLQNPPRNLKISPVAVVPQPGRRGRIILDLSFPVRRPLPGRRRMGPILEDSVNNTTATTAPQTPVKLIGVALFELFEFMAVAPTDTNILLAKSICLMASGV